MPNLYLSSVYELDTNILKHRNIQNIIIDIDNTLVAWETELADEKTIDLVKKLLADDFKVCILSNNTKKRVEVFNEALSLPAIHKAGKPRRSAYKKALLQLKAEPSKTAVIGDQIFTDVLGGNRMGMFTVLVKPINQKEFIGTRLVRIVERSVLKKLYKDK